VCVHHPAFFHDNQNDYIIMGCSLLETPDHHLIALLITRSVFSAWDPSNILYTPLCRCLTFYERVEVLEFEVGLANNISQEGLTE